MKFLHTADWHLGKVVHGYPMIAEQKMALQQLLHIIDCEQPDAVVVAGDLYDRAIPPLEAVDLLHETFQAINLERGIPLLAITGNHDSRERVSFGEAWYRSQHLYLNGTGLPSQPVILNNTAFHLVPYMEPSVVRQAFSTEEPLDHHGAMEQIIDEIRKNYWNEAKHHVFVGHAFIRGGTPSESERMLALGGAEYVGSDLFAPFTYTALGHLHHPYAISAERIGYSGSLLKYSFQEAQQPKGVWLIDIEEDGHVQRSFRPLHPERDVRILRGSLDELLQAGQSEPTNDFLKIELTDKGALLDPMQKIRVVYPNVLQMERVSLQQTGGSVHLSAYDQATKSPVDLFQQFYEEVSQDEYEKEDELLVKQTFERILAGGEHE